MPPRELATCTFFGTLYRVFFCIEGSTMVLLHGFMKKTQATPKREIEIARARQRTLRRRS
jgi:phage-related protein